MIAIDFALDLSALEDATRRLSDAIDREMAVAMSRVATIVATEAAKHHPYQNRSQDLQDNTKPLGVVGQFLAGSLASGVVAETDYAQYVDGNPRFAFLEPALERKKSEIDNEIQAAADRAAHAW